MLILAVRGLCLCPENNSMLGNDSNLLIVFYVQIMPDDFVMQLHRF
ncbi:pilus assembly protein [Escherichia coli]|nr:pilus assembly protein [Escherichia coli]